MTKGSRSYKGGKPQLVSESVRAYKEHSHKRL